MSGLSTSSKVIAAPELFMRLEALTLESAQSAIANTPGVALRQSPGLAVATAVTIPQLAAALNGVVPRRTFNPFIL